MPNVYVDGVDLSQWFVVYDVLGHRDIPTAVWPNRPVSGRIGNIVLSSEPSFQPRDITIDGHVIEDTMAEMRTSLNEIAARFHGDEHEVQIVDDTSRVFYARLAGANAFTLKPSLTTPKTQIKVRLTCLDPRAYSTGNSTLGFGSTDTPVPLGTAPVGGVIRFSGVASDPSVIYKTSTGLEVARITLNTTLSSTQFVDVDLTSYTLTGTTGANLSSIWASSVSTFFLFDPKHIPSIQVTAGSAGLTYTKADW